MNKITWKDIIFANIDGYNAPTLGIFLALLIIDLAISIDQLVQRLTK